MEYLVICIVALITSGLTLFSGFGLGTLLMPAFALFFPLEIAVALTAIVHFANNVFKFVLLGKHADKGVVLRFGLPAIVAAFLGARLLILLSEMQPLASYQMFGRDLQVMLVKLVVAILMIVFALFELIPRLEKMSFDRKYLPAGGILSGFFGGLSGHQGALRSAFLVKSGLAKESFIGTGVVIACLVDVTRLSAYGSHFSQAKAGENVYLLLAAIISAFLGAFIGTRLVKKVTMRVIQTIVSIMLIGIAIGLGTGIIK